MEKLVLILLIFLQIVCVISNKDTSVEPLPKPEALSFLSPVFLRNPFRSQSAERRTDPEPVRKLYPPPRRRRYPYIKSRSKPRFADPRIDTRARFRTGPRGSPRRSFLDPRQRPPPRHIEFREIRSKNSHRPKVYSMLPPRRRSSSDFNYIPKTNPRRHKAIHGTLEAALNYLWSYKKIAYDNLFAQSEAMKGISEDFNGPVALALVSDDSVQEELQESEQEDLSDVLEDIWGHHPHTKSDILRPPSDGVQKSNRVRRSTNRSTEDGAWTLSVEYNTDDTNEKDVDHTKKSLHEKQFVESRMGLPGDEWIAEITLIDGDQSNRIYVPVVQSQSRVGTASSHNAPYEKSSYTSYENQIHQHIYDSSQDSQQSSMTNTFRNNFVNVLDTMSRKLPGLGKSITVMSFLAFSVFVANLGVNSINSSNSTIFFGRSMEHNEFQDTNGVMNLSDLIFKLEEILTQEQKEFPEYGSMESFISKVAKDVYRSVEDVVEDMEEDVPEDQRLKSRNIMKQELESRNVLKSTQPKCYRKMLCEDSNRKRRTGGDLYQSIPFWMFGVSWINGTEEVPDLLEDLRAELAGLVSKDCDQLFPNCLSTGDHHIERTNSLEPKVQNHFRWTPVKLIVTNKNSKLTNVNKDTKWKTLYTKTVVF